MNTPLTWPEGRSPGNGFPLCPGCGHDFGQHSPSLSCPTCFNAKTPCTVDQPAVFTAMAKQLREARGARVTCDWCGLDNGRFWIENNDDVACDDCHDIPRQDRPIPEGCGDCGCPADDHNNAECGQGCTRCGDCDGFAP